MASMSISLPDPLVERLEEERRSSKFRRIPPMSDVIRSLIEEGFAHRHNSPRADATAEGKATTSPKGDRR